MATTLKVLGQSYPSATVLTALYTVPGATSSVCSSLTIANLSAVSDTFRVAVRVGGAGISNEHYLYYDIPINGNDTFSATLGITLATTDVVSVYSENGTLAFNLFGQEIT